MTAGFVKRAMVCASLLLAPLFTLAAPVSVQFVKAFCDGLQPYVQIVLHISPSDAGLPGLLYVASSDPSQTQANYLVAGDPQWYVFQGEAMYVPYAIVRTGLQDTTLTLPAGVPGWQLWVGYGALTPQGEAQAQAGVTAVAKARAAGRNPPPIDADYIRRALIQEDMKHNGKYIPALAWDSNTVMNCRPYGY